MINLEIYQTKEQWDEENNIVTGHKQYKFYNKIIDNRFISTKNQLINITPSKLRSMSDKDLKIFIESEGDTL